jgi:hypothetical protein
MKFSPENASAMGRRGVAARKRRPKDFRSWAEGLISDPRGRAQILRQAREGKLSPQTVALLINQWWGSPPSPRRRSPLRPTPRCRSASARWPA